MSRRCRPLFPLGIPGNSGGSLQESLASLALMFGEHGEDEGLERKRTGVPFRSQILGYAELGKEPRALLSPLLSCSRKKRSTMRLRDKHGRDITDLRVSITDRCNYRCVYCRTGNEGAVYSELPLSEYLRLVRILVGMGIEKVRLTGGEPLLRKELVGFVRDVAGLATIDGNTPDLSITTNGHLLQDLAGPLKPAGLRRGTNPTEPCDA